jgi:hypothetical protein
MTSLAKQYSTVRFSFAYRTGTFGSLSSRLTKTASAVVSSAQLGLTVSGNNLEAPNARIPGAWYRLDSIGFKKTVESKAVCHMFDFAPARHVAVPVPQLRIDLTRHN